MKKSQSHNKPRLSKWVPLIFVGLFIFLIKEPVLKYLTPLRDKFYGNIFGGTVSVEPSEIDFKIIELSQQKSFAIKNNLSCPIFAVRAVIAITGATGRDFSISEFQAPTVRKIDYLQDRQNIAYFYPVQVDNSNAILMYLPRLDRKR